jgi:hypothetical protein
MTEMRRGASIMLALTLVAPLSAAPRKAAPKSEAVPKLIQSCDAHKFETVVDAMVDGQPHKSKVKLCGVERQSDADWIGTLRDAIRKLDANKDMAPATREQIVAAINGEIARLSIIGPQPPARRERRAESASLLSRDYATLPPLPQPPETNAPPEIAADAPVAPLASTAPVQTDFAAVTPPRENVSPATAVPAAVVPLVAPRLTISCETPGDLGGPASCAEFDRETRLLIRADEAVPVGTELQFIRNGRAQGDISLDGLRKGGTLRTDLPRSVCSGFGAGRLELRITRGGGTQVLHSDGPYSLRC